MHWMHCSAPRVLMSIPRLPRSSHRCLALASIGTLCTASLCPIPYNTRPRTWPPRRRRRRAASADNGTGEFVKLRAVSILTSKNL